MVPGLITFGDDVGVALVVDARCDIKTAMVVEVKVIPCRQFKNITVVGCILYQPHARMIWWAKPVKM